MDTWLSNFKNFKRHAWLENSRVSWFLVRTYSDYNSYERESRQLFDVNLYYVSRIEKKIGGRFARIRQINKNSVQLY